MISRSFERLASSTPDQDHRVGTWPGERSRVAGRQEPVSVADEVPGRDRGGERVRDHVVSFSADCVRRLGLTYGTLVEIPLPAV